MLRRTFACLCLCSTLLGGAVVFGWARSYQKRDCIYTSLPRHYLGSIGFANGQIGLGAVADWPGFQRLRWQHAPFVPTDGPQTQMGMDLPQPNWNRSWLGLGVGVNYWMFAVRADGSGHISTLDGPLPHRMVYMPYPEARWVPSPLHYSPYLKEYGASAPCWMLVLLLSIMPAAWVIHRGRAAAHAVRRKRVGHCRRCGYDLRESPNTCPECGTHVEPNHAAATLN